MKGLEKTKEFFVGIDSDGCVFDTMELKHKECFIPNIIQSWGLQAVSKFAREAAEFVNLYSKERGINRFPALISALDLLAERKEVQLRNFAVPDIQSLRHWAETEPKLGNPALEQAVEKEDDPVLKQALAWSNAVNAAVESMVKNVPPFPYVQESMVKMAAHADMMVVSATPCDALEREWEEHGLARFVQVIAGQEMGKKQETLGQATSLGYGTNKVLMIGDAPGDLKAAKVNDALFYPINPGDEDRSWKRFYEQSFDRFIAGTYAGKYEAELIAEFEGYLPTVPPWRQ